ncbi:hypothetical protein H6G91_38425 [Nostoc muscorum FACHB-395]|nr:hypothetical protein [Desmonostoc muscorum FACHB-395]
MNAALPPTPPTPPTLPTRTTQYVRNSGKVAAPIKLEWSFFRLIAQTRARWQFGGMLEFWKKAIALTTVFKRTRTALRREDRKNRSCHKTTTQPNGTLKGTIKYVFWLIL